MIIIRIIIIIMEWLRASTGGFREGDGCEMRASERASNRSSERTNERKGGKEKSRRKAKAMSERQKERKNWRNGSGRKQVVCCSQTQLDCKHSTKHRKQHSHKWAVLCENSSQPVRQSNKSY